MAATRIVDFIRFFLFFSRSSNAVVEKIDFQARLTQKVVNVKVTKRKNITTAGMLCELVDEKHVKFLTPPITPLVPDLSVTGRLP